MAFDPTKIKKQLTDAELKAKAYYDKELPLVEAEAKSLWATPKGKAIIIAVVVVAALILVKACGGS